MRKPVQNRQSILDHAQGNYRAEIVAIDPVQIAATPWPRAGLEPMVIDIDGPAGNSPQAALPFLVVMTAINYRFWERNQDGTLSRYEFLGKTGARALWGAFEMAWEDATGFAERMAREPFESVFGAIPDKESRKAILTEVLSGTRLDDVCETRLFDVCDEIAQDVDERRAVTASHAGLLAQAFPLAFGDPYLKKAQLAISMYAGYLRSIGQDVSATDLTAMADYQVPRVLRALGILVYTPQLAYRIDGAELIAADSVEEKAIRAATVLACEQIAAHVGGTAADVDNLLWQSQDVAGVSCFHLTETTRY